MFRNKILNCLACVLYLTSPFYSQISQHLRAVWFYLRVNAYKNISGDSKNLENFTKVRLVAIRRPSFFCLVTN